MSVSNDDPYAAHDAVAELLPWYVNGSLGDSERERVERHIEVCVSCRGALKLERSVAAAVRDLEVEAVAARVAFSELERRLPRARPAPLASRGALLWSLLPLPLPRLALLAAPLVLVLVALPFVAQRLQSDPPTGPFRTLASTGSDDAFDAAHLRVVFAPALGDDARRAVLAAAGVRVVSGPSERGVYTVAATSSADGTAELVGALRETPGVALVEPVLAGPAPSSPVPRRTP